MEIHFGLSCKVMENDFPKVVTLNAIEMRWWPELHPDPALVLTALPQTRSNLWWQYWWVFLVRC